MTCRPVRVTRSNSTVLGYRASGKAWADWWAGKVRGRRRGHHTYAASWRGAMPTLGSGLSVAGILHVPCKPLYDQAWYRVRPLERLGARYAKRVGGVWWWMPVEVAR